MEHGLSRFGIKVNFVDLTETDALAAAMTSKTRFVFFETPTYKMKLTELLVGFVDLAALETEEIPQPVIPGADNNSGSDDDNANVGIFSKKFRQAGVSTA